MRSSAAIVALLCGLLCTTTSTALSKSPPRLLRKVAIIGCGISGLATAHALSSQLPDLDISVFDSRRGLDPLIGAGIQLNGGLKVLGDISPRVQDAIIRAGMPLARVRSQSRSRSRRNIGGTSYGRKGCREADHDDSKTRTDTLLDLDLQATIQKAGAKDLVRSDGTILWTSIMRGTLQQTLFDTLDKSLQRKVRFGKTLTNLIVGQDHRVYCGFSDSTKSGPFDLVIGCDGIKSAVKEYVDHGIISTDSSQREGQATGVYTGIRIRYAVQLNAARKTSTTSPVTFSQYFGDGCYCLEGTYGAAKSVTKSVFSIFLDDDYFGPFRKRKESCATNENADWSQDKMKGKSAKDVMIRQLQDANVDETPLLATIEQADRFFELGVYAHNPFCSWSKEIPDSDGAFAVLCGDAAHALPPFLGQGSNQAIQDAYCLALRLRTYNDAVARQDENVRLSRFLEEYESVRWMPNFQIFWKSAFLGYLETGGFNGLYSGFRNAFFKIMAKVGVAEKVLLDAASPKI